MNDVIADLRDLGEQTATPAVSLHLDRHTVRRVRVRQTMTVLASATFVTAAVIGIIVATGGLIHSAKSPSPASPGTSSPTTAPSTIILDPPLNTESFAPPPTDAHPEMTWLEAVAAFQVVDPEFELPADATGRLGLYTAAVGDGTYRYKDRLAWGISWHECARSFRHEVPPDFPRPCTQWLFLDANTGRMLESLWQLGS
jgi:hypothetical protein